jgi:DNA-binding MarR family transcriptional regulator
MTALYDRALEPAGITVAQWSLMRRIPSPGDEPITIHELAERAELERSTVARNLRVLAKSGLVKMSTSSADKRASAIVLTEQAVNVAAVARPLWQSAQAEVERMLSADDAGRLRSLALSVTAVEAS